MVLMKLMMSAMMVTFFSPRTLAFSIIRSFSSIKQSSKLHNSFVTSTCLLPSSRLFLSSQLIPKRMMSEMIQSEMKAGEEQVQVQEKRKFNMSALKKAVSKLYLKSVDKMGKLLEKESSGVSEETKGEEPDIKTALEEKIQILRNAEETLKDISSRLDPKFIEMIPALKAVQIDPENFYSAQPKKPQQTPAPPKEKPVKGPRKPYVIYKSSEGIEIFVGRGASDNDELSCNPEHRRSNEWWLHVADHAGSHVVIKCTDDDLPARHKETLREAALLAALNSKAKTHGKVAVHLTRCRNVSKPRGAKPGLVQLSDWRAVNVNLMADKTRVERLEKIG